MKVPATLLATFMNEGWPKPADDWYMDEFDAELWTKTFEEGDTYSAKNPEEVITLEKYDCVILYQGKDPEKRDKQFTLSTLFKKWRKEQDTLVIPISFPKEREAEVRKLLADHDIKIHKGE